MSTELKPHMTLSDRFFTAVLYASTIHQEQTRKSTVIPYICHPLGAAASVIHWPLQRARRPLGGNARMRTCNTFTRRATMS